MAIAMFSPIILAVLFQAMVTFGLWLWARWVSRRHPNTRWWRLAAWMPLVALTLTLISVTITSVYLLRAFDAVSGGDPSTKATRLAENISSALNVSAFLSLPSWVLYGASLLNSAVGSLLRPSPPR